MLFHSKETAATAASYEPPPGRGFFPPRSAPARPRLHGNTPPPAPVAAFAVPRSRDRKRPRSRASGSDGAGEDGVSQERSQRRAGTAGG